MHRTKAISKELADNLNIGIMIYNNPVTSKLWVPPDLMARLSKIENIVVDKENTTNAPAYYWMQKAVDPEDMVIVRGLGQLMYPFEALFGCLGYVTELVNFAPDIATGLYKAAMQKDFKKLTELTDKIAPYHEFITKVARKRGVLPTILSHHFATLSFPFIKVFVKKQ